MVVQLGCNATQPGVTSHVGSKYANRHWSRPVYGVMCVKVLGGSEGADLQPGRQQVRGRDAEMERDGGRERESVKNRDAEKREPDNGRRETRDVG